MKLRKLIVSVMFLSKMVFSEEYVVGYGDTLLKIAGINRLTLEELKKINSLTDERIITGQKLYVGEYKSHIVKNGENLGVIRKKYNITTNALMKINS